MRYNLKHLIYFCAFHILLLVNLFSVESRHVYNESLKNLSLINATTARNRAMLVRDSLTKAELSEVLHIEFSLKMRNTSELQTRVNNGEIISPKEMAQKYWPLKKDREKVAEWLKLQGFLIDNIDNANLGIFVSAPVLKIQSVLNAKFSKVLYGQKEYTAAVTAPSLPKSISESVLGINGLQPYIAPHPLFSISNKTGSLKSHGVGGSPPYFANQILSAYGLTSSQYNGSGQTIAIVGNALPLSTDLQLYWTNASVPQSLNNISYFTIGSGPLSSTDITEASLDIQIASSIATGSHINFYACDGYSDGFDQCYTTIYNDATSGKYKNLSILSISYGYFEDELSTSFLQSESQYMLNLASAGITVLAATGDGGSNPQYSNGSWYYSASNPLTVCYPGVDPNVTGVGGTTLYLTASNSISSEIAWSGSGGGISTYFARPSWQTGTGVILGSKRLTPDVAALGDPNTGVIIYKYGTDGGYEWGGTSLSTPIWAGFCAIINQARSNSQLGSLGLLNSKIYALNQSTSFNDIISGNNGAYSAGLGYDLCTGLGTPNVPALIKYFTSSGTTGGTPPVIVTQPQSKTASLGSNLSLTVVASGTAPLSYQWYLSGSPISGATSSIYNINVTSASSGVYYVTVTNAYGSVTSNQAAITVTIPAVPPTIAVQPVSQNVNLGSNLNLSVVATGTAPLAYQWNFNSIPITGANASTYTINSIALNQAGVYSVSISNSAGQVTSNDAQINVNNNAPVNNTLNGLIAYYPFSSSANDFSGNGYNALVKGASLVSDRFGYLNSAYNFSLPNSIVSSANIGISGNSDRSVSLWFYLNSIPTGSQGNLISWGAEPTGQAFSIVYSPYNAASGFTFCINAQNYEYGFIYANNAVLAINKWHHLVATYTTNIGSSCMYIDGVKLLATATNFGSTTSTLNTAQSPVYINQFLNESNTGINGSLDDIRIYNRVLTPIEVSYIYNTERIQTLLAVPPQIVTQPVSQTINVGSNLILSVNANGSSALTYQWYFNGNIIKGANSFSYTINAAQVTNSGNYSVLIADSLGTVTSNVASINVLNSVTLPVITLQPLTQSLNQGSSLNLSISATGIIQSYQWYFNGVAILGANSSSYTIVQANASNSGTYTCSISNSAGTVVSNPANITVIPLAPIIILQPSSQSLTSGASVILSVSGYGANITYQWYFNNIPISGATSSSYTINSFNTSAAGSYTVMLKNAGGSILSNPAILKIVSNPGRLINLSVLAMEFSNAKPLTIGFVTGGAATSGAQNLLIRGVGPSLAAYSISNFIPDPMLTVFNSSSVGVTSNDNWGTPSSNVSIISAADTLTGAFPYTSTSSLDSALVASLSNGAYTVQIATKNSATGYALAEVYDATSSGAYSLTNPRLINISCLQQISSGSSLTAGFVIGGSTTEQVLIRVVGPTLGSFGIAGYIPDPKLVVYNSASSIVANNAGWGGNSAISAANSMTGAFQFSSNSSKDSAVIINLQPGSYTVQASSASGVAGVVLIEVYEVSGN
jgi:kumamolisin